MEFIEIKAPAKINIGLNIVNKRNDGYHDLETFFYPINDLYDTLTFTKSDKFSFRTDSWQLTDEGNNLVVKAKTLLENECGKELKVGIELTKRIPLGAGLGGGSSDAAAAIISLNEMFGLGLTYEQQIDIALKLGSDIPFFIKAKPAVGYSRGEKLVLKNDFELNKSLVIVNPGIHISTKEAFGNISPEPSGIVYGNIFNSEDSFLKNKSVLRNDFEQFVFSRYPAIKQIKDDLYASGAEFALMSGSGSTVYGVFQSKDVAETAALKLNPDYFIFVSTSD